MTDADGTVGDRPVPDRAVGDGPVLRPRRARRAESAESPEPLEVGPRSLKTDLLRLVTRARRVAAAQLELLREVRRSGVSLRPWVRRPQGRRAQGRRALVDEAPIRSLPAAARHGRQRPHHAPPLWVVNSGLLIAMGTGIGLVLSGLANTSDPMIRELAGAEASPAASVATTTPYMVRPAGAVRAAGVRAAPNPAGLIIPTLGIDQPLIQLGIMADGALEAPRNRTDIGWWSDGPAPDETGAVVVAAHVSFNGDPAVFAALSTMEPGELIYLPLVDGTLAVYQVVSVEQFPKAEFPDARVYTREGPTRLRLITCGGDVNPATRHFVDNVVVFADRVDPAIAPKTAPPADPNRAPTPVRSDPAPEPAEPSVAPSVAPSEPSPPVEVAPSAPPTTPEPAPSVAPPVEPAPSEPAAAPPAA